jgi:alpha-amylase
VYTNAKEYGNGRDFPRGGKDDALGGVYGEAITTLVDIRNTHGRGNFHERWIDFDGGEAKSNIYVYERENSAVVGLNSRVESGFDQRTVGTGFAPGTVLVELTGNATDFVVDPYDDIKDVVRVDGSGQLTMSIPRNKSTNFGGPGVEDDVETAHLRGYVVYGLPTPQGALSISNVSQVLQGATPTAANNGTARLADIDVITADSFNVRLDTAPVSLQVWNEATPYRDVDADGDNALIKIDGGVNLNSTPGVDHTTPGSVVYGFEEFTGTKSPGYFNNGVGVYEQQIDATQLHEGRHYVTIRAFRHRDSGPAVFSDFKRTVYVDRLPAVSTVASFDPYSSNPNNPNNRDLIVRSVDGTADNVHIYLDLPANVSNAQIFQMTQLGQNDAAQIDRDLFVFGFDQGTTPFGGVTTGNHVVTVVTFEPTGRYNIQRFAGLLTNTNIGAGFGDLNHSGTYTVSDILGTGNNSAEDILYSQNGKFRASFDVNGDGLGDNRDLFALGAELTAGGVSQPVLNAYTDLLLKRGDFNSSGATNSADLAALYSHFGPATWLYDLNVDGVVNINDVSTMITEVFRTVPGDINLDGSVDSGDYVMLRKGAGTIGAQYTQGDADLDGDVDAADLNAWQSNFGFARQPLQPGGGMGSNVPEPSSPLMLSVLTVVFQNLKPRVRRTAIRSHSLPSSNSRPLTLDT